MDSTLAPSFEIAVTPPVFTMPRMRLTTGADPVTIGLQMANWLVLMVLMSGFMLASTMSDRSEPAGSSAEIGTAATR